MQSTVHMKTLIKFTIILFFPLSIFSQEQYSRAKIWFEGEGLSTLSSLGLAVDHGSVKHNAFIVSDFSKSEIDRKSTRLNSSHVRISYAVFCLKKKKKKQKVK